MKHLLLCSLATLFLTACQQSPTPSMQTSSKVGSIAKQYDSALDAFKKIVAFDGGDLETRYHAAKRSYEQGRMRSESATHLITRIDESAKKVLAEWETEIEEYSDPARQRDSQARLDSARKQHEKTMTELREAQTAMQPVLVEMHDLVLYLRHRLNEVALNGVPVPADEIEKDVADYRDSINDAILKAEDFLENLDR